MTSDRRSAPISHKANYRKGLSAIFCSYLGLRLFQDIFALQTSSANSRSKNAFVINGMLGSFFTFFFGDFGSY